MSGPGIHGRTHVTGGTDPIPGLSSGGGIQFGIENEGTFLDVLTTSTGPTTYGISLEAGASSVADPGIILNSTGYIRISSGDVLIGSTNALEVTGAITTFGVGNQAIFPREIRLQLANTTTGPQGSKVVVYDAAGVSVFEVRDDGSVHIKTGTAPVADL